MLDRCSEIFGLVAVLYYLGGYNRTACILKYNSVSSCRKRLFGNGKELERNIVRSDIFGNNLRILRKEQVVLCKAIRCVYEVIGIVGVILFEPTTVSALAMC